METKKGKVRPAKTTGTFVVSVGSVEVPVYFTEVTKNGVKYPTFTVCHYGADEKRVRRSFADRDDARKEAERIAFAISRGQAGAVALTSADAAAYNRALALLKPHSTPLVVAVESYVHAIEKLPSGITLSAAAEFYVSRHPAGMRLKTVAEVTAEFRTDLESRRLSEAYIENAVNVHRHFDRAFSCPIASVTPEMFRRWRDGRTRRDGSPESGRSKLNAQRAFSALVNFAARRNYTSRDHAKEFGELEAPKAGVPSRAVFTPEAFAKLLAEADSDTLPAFVLGGFCGIRTAEIARMKWEQHVKFAQRVVMIDAEIAKTGSRRVVPICDAAMEWLAPYADATGPVLPVDERVMVRVGDAAGVPWVKNGLRHSFCSCRLAVLSDFPKVAYEAGNSPQMIREHYQSLTTEAEAKAWFNIRPMMPANVIAIPSEARG